MSYGLCLQERKNPRENKIPRWVFGNRDGYRDVGGQKDHCPKHGALWLVALSICYSLADLQH